MIDPPRQDWDYFNQQVRPARLKRLRSLTPQRAFAIYEDMHDFAASQCPNDEQWRRFEQRRRERKIALRKRMCSIFQKLDQIKGE